MFLRNQKKKSADTVAPQQEEHPVVAEKKAPQALSEEGLFDIAFENYKQAHPESGMKRRDFRRNIWNSEEVSEYLNDSQYRKYLEYTGAVEPSAEPVLAQEEEAAGEPADGDGIADVSDDFLSDAPSAEELLLQDMAEEGEPADPDAVSELEPAFDDSFLDDLPADDSVREDGMISDEDEEAAEPEESDPLDLFGDVPDAGEVASEDEQAETKAVLAEDAGELPEVDAGLPAETKVEESDPLDEGAVVMGGEEEVKEEPETEEDENNPVDEETDPSDLTDAAEDALTGDASLEAQPAHTGIFAQEGIMGKLRRSMYLDENDSSLDDEILSLSRKEIFEQLIRLEGCVRKVGVISDLAQQIFTQESETAVDDGPVKKERLMEIVGNAAEAIGYMMHYSCSDVAEWNHTIADHLGLTEEERTQGIIPEQPLNKEYVIRCYNMGVDDSICVRGDYTQICRAVFLYEQAYHTMEVRPLMQFLESVGLDWYASPDADVAADIEIFDGKVFLV